jgi:hypothetical protein
MNHSYALAPWPEIIPREKIKPVIVITGDHVTVEDVFVAGGGDGILVESGHNNFNRVEAIGGHAGINLKGPGYNNLNEVKSVGGQVSIIPATPLPPAQAR